MEIRLNYGTMTLALSLPDTRQVQWLKPTRPTPVQSEAEIIQEALRHPVSIPPLEELCRKGERTTIVVPDRTRESRLPLVLPQVIKKLNDCGIRNRDITIVFANGSHEPQSAEERRTLLGDEVFRHLRAVDHNCHKTDDLVHLGETRFGTPVFVNELVFKAERLIVVGGVFHHYFAGFGGGPKLINPGCAGYETILRNHRLTIDPEAPRLHPNCRDGVLDGNPVYEDIVDSLKFVHCDFLLNTLHDDAGGVIGAIAGEVLQSHREACQMAERLYTVPVSEKADLVIVSCGGFPRDINFIQAHKSIQHGFYAAREGGVMIVLAQCRQGVGSKTFLDWFAYDTIGEMHRALLTNFSLNGNTALSLREKLRAVKIILLSSLDPNVVVSMGMIPASSPEKAVEAARQFLPQEFGVAVIPNGAITVPRTEEA